MDSGREKQPHDRIQAYYERYLSNIRLTAGCRFEASRRLEQRDIASSITIASLSLYPIVLSISGTLLPESTATTAVLIGTITSLLVLVISLLEYSRKYSVRASRMQQCAQDLNEIFYKLEFLIESGRLSAEEFEAIKIRYDRIIDKYPENHTQKDFHYYRATHRRNLKDSWRGRIYIAYHLISHFVSQWAFYVIALAIPPAVLVYTLKSN